MRFTGFPAQGASGYSSTFDDKKQMLGLFFVVEFNKGQLPFFLITMQL
ncbi:hypothetical protein HQN90_36325 [Paenibacillus alba]|nr:hypothetical protein [Paenibacillus alba]